MDYWASLKWKEAQIECEESCLSCIEMEEGLRRINEIVASTQVPGRAGRTEELALVHLRTLLKEML